jgi:molybdate transport system substrate-binding protein
MDESRNKMRQTEAINAYCVLLCAPPWGNAVPEIKVISTTAMKTSLDDLTAEFERATGHTLALSFGPSARIKKQVADGEPNDITIATDKGIDELIAQGRIVPGTRADLARSAMALAVQKGAPKPDISSAEKFKAAMLAVKSLGMSNPVGGGQSGANLVAIFEWLGIADAMKPKCFYGPGGPAGLIGNYLVRKEIEVGIQQLPELMAVPGIDIVGPLPPDIQNMTVFSAGLSTAAKNADGAKALIQFLATPDARAVIKSKGLEAS